MAASGGGPEAPHRPVLLFEAVGLLAPERGGLFVDATLGLGGHSEAILEASPDTRVVGDVAVLGYLTYLEVWELERFERRLLSDPYTEEDEAAIARLGI